MFKLFQLRCHCTDSRDMFKLVQLGPHCTGPQPPPPMDMFKLVQYLMLIDFVDATYSSATLEITSWFWKVLNRGIFKTK